MSAPGSYVHGTNGMSRSRRRTQPTNKKRRVVRHGELAPRVRDRLRNARYGGSPHHKSKPADYGFPPAPRATKSLCDDGRPVKLKEATRLFRSGIAKDMVSKHLNSNNLPAYVWSVDEYGQPFEAKPGGDGNTYHGYRLDRDDPASDYILDQWKGREKTSDE